jgi:DHA1 family bicyclomycin/chloramphenicol resistance-like MFS transporter
MDRPPERRVPRAPLWLLVLVTLSGTTAMHIFVPALPMAGVALGASTASMQQTITLYVLGLAFGQLIYGPISDALGRRPALLMGLAVYLSASLVAMLAPSLPWLVGARLLQAIGGAAGLVLGRAIVRDMAGPGTATKDLALLNLLTMVGPGLAPILGGLLAEHFGWRAIYVFLVLIGSAMLFFSHRLLPETNLHRRPLRLRFVGRDYLTLGRDRAFQGYALGGACATTALYPYLACVAYIVHGEMGLPVSDVGWFAAATIVGASIGTMLTRRLSSLWPASRFLSIGSALALTMAATMLGLHALGWLTPVSLLVVTMLLTAGSGLASPAAISGALSSVPSLAGAAAGVYGAAQMLVGAVGTAVVALGDSPIVACAVTQMGLLCIAGLSFRAATRAQRPPRPATPRRTPD